MSRVVELRQSEADRYDNAHDWLKQKLGLPEWYGHNLDALWDCVTGHLPKPLKIRWIADSAPEKRYSAIVEVFQDAADQYDEISFEYVTKK
ncbi:barstar family protein [Paenibacillus sp.]|jgi:ribonuclease inhibitor|uniref:barstar family protein n=1 Tax=Paenibacillus sp. TaxID=58172 RepID=UPI0028216DA8|nr:barstar family protein [Paenibacillus sp.]MDR0267806.1 barstar family protein [Paenibacillus sp.]